MINWTVLEAILYRQKTVNDPIDASWIGQYPPEHWPCIAIIDNKTNNNIRFPFQLLAYVRAMRRSLIIINKESSSSEKKPKNPSANWLSIYLWICCCCYYYYAIQFIDFPSLSKAQNDYKPISNLIKFIFHRIVGGTSSYRCISKQFKDCFFSLCDQLVRFSLSMIEKETEKKDISLCSMPSKPNKLSQSSQGFMKPMMFSYSPKCVS